MDRAQKAEAVAELKQTFSEVGVVVVTRNLGLTVAQSTELRNKMRDAGATYKVSKNKLAKIALDGTDYLSLGDMLTGPVGLATSNDPVAAAKIVVDFAKTNDKLEIVGGAMGATALDVEWRQEPGDDAVARRTACEDRRPSGGTRHQDRDDRAGTGSADRARPFGLCREGSRITFLVF